MNLTLEGILCANVTPFKENLPLDEVVLRRLIRHLAKAGGISAYVCNAGTGEERP